MRKRPLLAHAPDSFNSICDAALLLCQARSLAKAKNSSADFASARNFGGAEARIEISELVSACTSHIAES
jgi:hypothetical protein